MYFINTIDVNLPMDFRLGGGRRKMIDMSNKKQPSKFTSQIHLQIHPCVLDEIHLSRGDEIHPWVGKEIRPPHVQLNKGDWTPTWLYSATARSP